MLWGIIIARNERLKPFYFLFSNVKFVVKFFLKKNVYYDIFQSRVLYMKYIAWEVLISINFELLSCVAWGLNSRNEKFPL